MGFSTVNGASLAWQQFGDSGPELIFIHGLATSRAFWFLHAMALREQCRITLFDLRGHGYSERGPGRYRCVDLAHDVLGLMDALGIEHAILAGHSYGGAIALESAALAPDRVSRLALFDARIVSLQPQMRLVDMPYLSDFEREVAGDSGIDWDAETQVGFKFLEAAARRRLAGRETIARDDFTPFGEGRGALRAARQWIELLDQGGIGDDLHARGVEPQQIAALPMPMLLMYAQRSRCLPSGEALNRLLPKAAYSALHDAGHFFPISHAPQVIERLREFVS